MRVLVARALGGGVESGLEEAADEGREGRVPAVDGVEAGEDGGEEGGVGSRARLVGLGRAAQAPLQLRL